MVDTKALIDAAVDWWAIFFGNPSIEGLPGDTTSQESFLTLAVTASVQNNRSVKTENITAFKKKLAAYFEENKIIKTITIGTDYVAEYPLSQILRDSGVSNAFFPQKTTMSIDFTEGTVLCWRAGGDTQQVYPTAA